MKRLLIALVFTACAEQELVPVAVKAPPPYVPPPAPPAAPAPPPPAPEPPCEAEPTARIEKLTGELADASEERKAWVEQNCKPAPGLHSWYDGRGIKRVTPTTPLWLCAGRLVDDTSSRKERELLGELATARADLKTCSEKVGPFFRSR